MVLAPFYLTIKLEGQGEWAVSEAIKSLSGDIDCCPDPPATCPRRYCSLAFRSFERAMEEPEPKKKKKKQVKKKSSP